MVEKKPKQYIIDNARLMAEWDWEENQGLSPKKLTLGSNVRASWKCQLGHKWKAVIAHRAKSGCPYCSGRMAIPGVNDLQTLFPELAAEWHPSKNNLSPNNIVAFSGKTVWWLCVNGHEWPATVINRSKRKSGCPYCSGRKAILGENDLTTTNPELASEWHPTLNVDITPQGVMANSHNKVWWKCKSCGNEWRTAIYSRSGGNGCPVCGKKQKKITLTNTQLVKTGSLLDNNPSLAAEWHPTKNGELLPSQVLPNANKKVWWQCEKGHEWPAVIQSRNNGAGCPQCSSELQTSFPEQVILYYFSKVTNAYSRYIVAPRTEIDVYLPDFKIAIEYDGIRYHRGKQSEEKEERKNKRLSKMGIYLFRVKETEGIANKTDSDNVIYCEYSSNYLYLNEVVLRLLARIGALAGQEFNIDVNVNRDRAEIYDLYISMEKENSLANNYPEIAIDWHPSKNGKLLPSQVSKRSNKIVWWLCSICGHEWETAPNNRVSGTGCPICNRLAGGAKRVSNMIAKRGSLASKLPDLAKEWHPFLNEGLRASEVTAFSNKKVWWLCPKCSHEWEAIISSRSRGTGCPKCAKQKRKKQ